MIEQAPFSLVGRNPDVLTCIANLSNDEVFTPPEFANQMLDALAEHAPAEAHWTRPQGGLFMINAGFYRNRGAYLLGRIAVPGFGMLPLLSATLMTSFIAMLVALPLVVRAVAPAIGRLPPTVLEAARLAGAGPWRRWWGVRLPMVRAAVAAAAGLALVAALGEFGATTFLTRSGRETMPIAIARLLGHAGQIPRAQAFALAENSAFSTGDGSGHPQGITVGGTSAGTTVSATTITADEVMDCFYALDYRHQPKAKWMAANSTIKILRKLKDDNNQYLWAPGFAGEPPTILGQPLIKNDDMPAATAGLKPLICGNFDYFWIFDRQEMELQRLVELYAGNGQVGRAFGTPPSTRMTEPVMKLAAGDSRKTIAAATSASMPKRCSGTLRVNFRACSMNSGG